MEKVMDKAGEKSSAWRDWLMANRTSTRLAFIFRMAAMAFGSGFSLLWTRLLLRAMGDELNGQFLNFLAVASLGGLGDFGVSGAISIQAGLMLGRGEDENLKKMLASARTLFLLLAGVLLVAFVALCLWLPGWLRFEAISGTGSLPLLFVGGGLMAATFVGAGYFHSLNFAHGTVTWPILPTMLIGQVLAPFLHWRLALLHAPLWIQIAPYPLSTLLTALLVWRMLKVSHPWLGNLRPLGFDRAIWRALAGASGWVYLSSLGNKIYINTDRLVIQAGFGPGIIPTYHNNFKACDLATSLILTASFVALPKITQWIASPDSTTRDRLTREVHRLNEFQIVLGCFAALGYLALNDWFISLWLGSAYRAPLAWQFAFACNLAVTTGGDAGIQLSSRCGPKGIRATGLAVGGTGLLNLGLSILSAKLGSITGVAVATIIAQSALSLSLGWYACRFLGLSVLNWSLKSWLLPICVVGLAYAARRLLPPISVGSTAALLTCYAVLVLITARLAGLKLKTLHAELEILRALGRR